MGPNKLVISMLFACALGGLNSSNLGIILAMLFMLMSASSPPMTPLQLASPPARPSGRNRDSWKQRPRTTGPRTPSISLSGSKRRARSCRKGWTSDGVNTDCVELDTERSGAERLESEMSGATSSAAPSGLLISCQVGKLGRHRRGSYPAGCGNISGSCRVSPA